MIGQGELRTPHAGREQEQKQYVPPPGDIITLDAQLRTFQYKIIIHRVFPTNKLLCTYKIRTEHWCDKCNNIVETLEHLFYLCPEKLVMWYQMADCLVPKLDIYPFTNMYIIFGIYNEILLFWC